MLSIRTLLQSGLNFSFFRQIRKNYLSFYRQIKRQSPAPEEITHVEVQPQSVSHASFNPVLDNAICSSMVQQQLVDRLNAYVLEEKNVLTAEIDREELSVALSTNRTTLSRAVKAVTNKTLIAYINFLLLEKAKQTLFSHPELTVEAIAEQFGFNIRTFHRHFYKYYQTNPDRYRKLLSLR